MQDHVLDRRRVGSRVGVRVGLAGPSGVIPGAELGPGRPVQQRDHRRLGGHDALQRVQRRLLGGLIGAAHILREGGLGLRVVEPAEVVRGGLARAARWCCCPSSCSSSSTGSGHCWTSGSSSAKLPTGKSFDHWGRPELRRRRPRSPRRLAEWRSARRRWRSRCRPTGPRWRCWGLGLYALGSLVCGFSFFSSPINIRPYHSGNGGRSNVSPMGAYLISTFPIGQRGKAIGFNVGIGSIFLMLGPMIGGAITEYFNWRYLFFLNLPIAFFGFYMTLKIVPLKINEICETEKKEFDYLGALFLALSMGSITIALMQGAKWGWGSVPIFLLFFGSAFFLILFLVTYKRFSEPIVDLSLFKQPLFTGATSCGCLAQLIAMVTVFWVVYLQQSLGFCPITSGWAIVLTNFPPIFIAPFGGHLADSLGVKLPVTIGFSLLIFALCWITVFSPTPDIVQLFPAFFSFGFGMALVMSPSYVASMEEVSDEKRAAASSLSLALRQLSPTFGMAILSAFYLTILEAQKPTLMAFRAINIIAAFIAFIGILISLFFLPSRRKTVEEF